MVIGTDTDRSATYGIVLTLHSNHEPVLYRFRDKRLFQSKIENFSHPVYLTPPADRVLLGIGYRRK